jgi:hypothetical protein
MNAPYFPDIYRRIDHIFPVSFSLHCFAPWREITIGVHEYLDIPPLSNKKRNNNGNWVA